MWFTVSRYLHLRVIRELGSSDEHYHKQSRAQYLQEHRKMPLLYVCVFVCLWTERHSWLVKEKPGAHSTSMFLCHEICAAACNNFCLSEQRRQTRGKRQSDCPRLCELLCEIDLGRLLSPWWDAGEKCIIGEQQCQMRTTAARGGCSPAPTDAQRSLTSQTETHGCLWKFVQTDVTVGRDCTQACKNVVITPVGVCETPGV